MRADQVPPSRMYFSFVLSLVRPFISGGSWGEGDLGYLTIAAQACSR